VSVHMCVCICVCACTCVFELISSIKSSLLPCKWPELFSTLIYILPAGSVLVGKW